MQQLSGADYVSLFAERRNVYNHVGALLVYDATTAPGGKVRFRDILRHFEARLYLHPVFRRRLVPVPFGLDRPYWVTDPDIDVEYHIRHIALPKPGDGELPDVSLSALMPISLRTRSNACLPCARRPATARRRPKSWAWTC